MKKKIMLGVAVCIIAVFIMTPIANAQQTSFNSMLISNGNLSNVTPLGTEKYKYVVVTAKASSNDALYTVSFIGSNSTTGSAHVYAISTSVKKFSGKKKYNIYILPKSGMRCPSQADYCFGAGAITTGTTVIQGNECNNNFCPAYGVRINNKKSINYNISVTYEFFK